MNILHINNIISILDLATLVPRTVWILASSITNRVCIVGITLANLLIIIRVWIARARIHTTRVRTLVVQKRNERPLGSRLKTFSRAQAH